MTASQFAQLLRARRTGCGKWQAKCPAHSDRKPSLSIAEGKRGVLVKCMSNGCDTRDILGALGLSYSDLFYDKITPQVRARTSLQEQRENLELQLGLAMWLQAVDTEKKPYYWKAAESGIRRQLQLVRCRLEPVKVIQEQRSEQWQRMNRRQREAVLENVWLTHHSNQL